MESPVSHDVLQRLARAVPAGVRVEDSVIAGLRAPRLEDVDAMVVACNDPEARNMTELPAPYDRDHALEFITESAATGLADGSLTAFVVAGHDDHLLGVVSLHDIDESAVASVGYWVVPWARGRGVASAGLAALVGWAFDVVGLRRLVWQSLVGNLRSLHVATQAGFTPEGSCRGLLRHRDHYTDCWLASIGPDDPRQPIAMRNDAWVEIAAGAWQLQPITTLEEGIAAEAALPVSACLPVAVWAVKDAVTAQTGAYVALLTRGGKGWVIAAPADHEATENACASGQHAVTRYARLGLGLQLL